MSEAFAASVPVEVEPTDFSAPPGDARPSDGAHLTEVKGGKELAVDEASSGGPKQSKVEIVGLAITLIGVLLALFILYLYVFSALSGTRSQNRLLHTLSSDAHAVYQLALGETPKNGSPVAVLNIPTLDLHQAVVEGTTSADLQAGPGLADTSQFVVPGEPGNAVIAGRRISFGGPFRGIGSLVDGDRIQVIDGAGNFEFTVTSVRTVGQGSISVPTYGRSWLVLVTSNSSWLPTGRSVVVARLIGQTGHGGKSSGGPITLPNLAGDPSAGFVAALWAIAFVALLVLMFLAIRRWRQVWVSWLLGAPLLLACGLLACESLARCLPSTL
jgi:sortase A